MNTERCRSCKHWEPMFTGEAWGVRSFIDAPPEVKEEIKAKLVAFFQENDYHGTGEALGYPEGIAEQADSGASDVPGGLNWPEWGECALTRLEDTHVRTSLARAIDGSMYHAVLRCHGEFGCVQWEKFA